MKLSFVDEYYAGRLAYFKHSLLHIHIDRDGINDGQSGSIFGPEDTRKHFQIVQIDRKRFVRLERTIGDDGCALSGNRENERIALKRKLSICVSNQRFVTFKMTAFVSC